MAGFAGRASSVWRVVLTATVWGATFASVPVTALAQAPEATAAQSEVRSGRQPIQRYDELLRQTLRKLVAREPAAALMRVRQALRLAPERPEAHYYMAEALKQQRRTSAALQAYAAAARAAATAGDLIFQGRALLATARLLERDRDRWAEAKQAWETYLAFAQAHPDAAFVETARARLRAVGIAEELRLADGAVRERILRREQASQARQASAPMQ